MPLVSKSPRAGCCARQLERVAQFGLQLPPGVRGGVLSCCSPAGGGDRRWPRNMPSENPLSEPTWRLMRQFELIGGPARSDGGGGLGERSPAISTRNALTASFKDLTGPFRRCLWFNVRPPHAPILPGDGGRNDGRAPWSWQVENFFAPQALPPKLPAAAPTCTTRSGT